ncbi:EmrB/QacA subfamily drug resistance transporter [Pseudonocardia hierapolitana]|uniref:EmrB/QacA subfamily drug resistance transporter n=1 Tax=Pseudonocardia hierapolitana TaxID=1128676 RepID=A0A561SL68_9PSEU|nr:MDR family MFS transporter [Pseudonocardia hierapolitana]TWF75603.1 EmrB/QacA subfamily drug resistance transporter [Pseudonocardia hierapolitana]
MTKSLDDELVRADERRTDGARPTPPPSKPPAPPPPPAPPATGWGLPLAVLITGMFMSVLDLSIVNVAIPSIRKDLGASIESVQWISTAYSLTEGVMVPASAWLGARFGLKRLYVALIVLFTIASLLCALSTGLGGLIGFRILQAIPGGVLPVTCMTILFRIVPKEKLGAAMGMYGLGIVVAPGIGPTLGGYLVEHTNWRVIFLINVPVGILGAIAAALWLTKFPAEKSKPFDYVGFLCIAASLFSLLLALEEGDNWGWTDYRTVMLFLGAAVFMALFIVVELHVEHPVLDIRVFKYWPYVNSLLLISAMSIGLFAVLFYVPSFLQDAQGWTPLNTGITLLPQALAMALLMPFAGLLYDKIGARLPAVFGLALVGSGILLLSRINVDITRGELILGMVVMATGMALGMMPIMTGGLSVLPPDVSDSGSAFNTLTQRVSSALGLAMMTALVQDNSAQFMADRSNLMESGSSPEYIEMQQQGTTGLLPMYQEMAGQVQAAAYSSGFFIAGSLTLVGVVLALFLRSGKPAGGGDRPVAH